MEKKYKLNIENDRNIYVNDKILVTVFTPMIKELEDKKIIELIIVDNSDFYTLYIIRVKNKEEALKQNWDKIIKEIREIIPEY